jgi:hypothetical protein
MNLSLELTKIASELVSSRMTLRREYFIPKGNDVKKITPRGTDLEIYLWGDASSGYYGMGFGGRRNKPDFNYIFRNERHRDDYVKKYIRDAEVSMEQKSLRRQERIEFSHELKIGDILYSSWGYDQTNVDFYEVVSVTAKSVGIRKIHSKIVSSSQGSDSVVAVPGRFSDSKVLVRRVNRGNCVKLTSYSSACLWDGRPKHETSVGWGH